MSHRPIFLPLCVALGLAGLALAATLLFAQARPHLTVRTYPGPAPCDTTLQACIDGSMAGDMINISAGTYITSVSLTKAVSLIGAGSDTTIIQAPPNQRVMYVPGPGSGVTITHSTVISGLTFANGFRLNEPGGGVLLDPGAQPSFVNVVIANNRGTEGGGLYANVNSSPMLVNVSFLSNTATMNGGGAFFFSAATLNGGRFENNAGGFSGNGFGGGLYADSRLTLTGTQFISNTTPDAGGGAYVSGPAALTGGRFERNRTSQSTFGSGGGLYVVSTLTLSDTQFVSNTAYTAGGALAGGAATLNGGRFENNTGTGDDGGGLFAFGALTLTNTQFISNTVVNNGGGAFVAGVATLNGGMFEHNSGLRGGGLYALSTLALTGTQFAGNMVSGDGGGAYFIGPATLNGGRFENNRAGDYAGGLRANNTLTLTGTQFISNTASGNGGGGLRHEAGNARIVNALFARNSGGAMYLTSPGNVAVLHTTIAAANLGFPAIAVYSGTVGITNTIITSHTVGIYRIDGTVFEDHNLFFDNTSDIVGTVTSGGNSINGNPAFAHPATDDYHLGFGSAAINAGTNAGVATDFDGDARPLDGGFDIGFDEWSRKFVYLPLVVK